MPSCSFCGAADCDAISRGPHDALRVNDVLRSCRIRVFVRMRDAEHELRAMVAARDEERGAELRARIMGKR